MSDKKPMAITSPVWKAFMAQYQHKRTRKTGGDSPVLPESRYFRTNSGTTDYVAIASTTPAEIEMTVYPVSGAASLPGSPAVTLLKLQTIRYAYAGGAITQLFNGFRGIVADLKFYNASGVLINFWPMNEGSGSSHVDVIGGNNGTIINGQPTDWELFERLPGSGEWVGKELVTNGDGASAVGWSTAGSTSISVLSVDGELRVRTEGTSGAEQKFATSPGSRYRVSGATRNDSVATDVRIRFNDQSFVGTIIGEIAQASLGDSASGSGVFAALGSQSAVYLRNQSSGLGFFDNISIRRILEIA